MASSKRPTYKVETKLATDRKRRKSDLVIMWQSVQGITNIILNELWITLLRMWELMKLWFSTSEQFEVVQWLEKHLPYAPDDFSQSWRDGRLLALLLNKLQPGCFPDAPRLDPEYGLKNVYRVFDALEMYFRIKPNVSPEEIVTCYEGSDKKLFAILLELKSLTDVPSVTEDLPEPEPVQTSEPPQENPQCIAKGTGLAVAFVGRMANFMIFCANISDLDVVVEVRGPNSICSERITKRSPRKKRSTSSWEFAKHLTRSVSLNQNGMSPLIEECENIDERIILLEYEITGKQICLGYKPKEKGKHKITILWHGWHVSDSPYFVTVDEPSEVAGSSHPVSLKSALKMPNENEKHDSRKISVRFQESQFKPATQAKPSGKILSRKVLRYIVKIHGKEIPVNAENTESLATELLKMDYDFETCPSFHRRNSWGFTGDAERKKSVIRQFCVDVNELDAQISLRRSRSLSVNPASKKLLDKSGSFENLAVCFEGNGNTFENESDYAYISEDTEMAATENETKPKHTFQKVQHALKKTNTISLSSTLTGSKLIESFKGSCEIRPDKISSLSIDTTEVVRDDSPKDDPEQHISSCSPILKKHHLNVDKIDKTLFDQQISNMELHNSVQSRETYPLISKSVGALYNDKISVENSKHERYLKKKCLPYPLKKSWRASRKFPKPPKTIYIKVLRNRGSVHLTPTTIFRKRMGLKKPSKSLPSKISKEFFVTHLEELRKQEVGHKNLAENIKVCSCQSASMSPKNATGETNKESVGVLCSIETVSKSSDTNSDFFKDTHRNITDKKVINITKSPKRSVEEPIIEKCIIYHRNLNANTPLSIGLKHGRTEKSNPQRSYSLKSVEESILNWNLKEIGLPALEVRLEDDVSVGKCQPLRTHKLKSLERFNFKQFNPHLDTPKNISPIKAQIVRWENALSSVKQDSCSQNANAANSEQVSVKEKLAFWENAYRTEQRLSPQNTFKNNTKMNLEVRKMSSEDNSDSVKNDSQNLPSTGHDSDIPITILKEKNETPENKDVNLQTKKQTDKISSELQVNPQKIRRRSFSDPVVSAESNAVEKTDNSLCSPSSESSKKEYSSSSVEDNFESDSGDSGGDYILHSTEDEYIDDEISERASEYWGDLSIVNGWKENKYTADHSILEEEFFLSYYQRDKSYAEECKVFGIAVYYGHVAVKNRFQVYTGNAGYGNLSVCMQGFRPHEVSLISVVYVRNDIYEVTYQVMTAGYYLISIRWMDRDIPGSPYVCKVTF